MSVTTANVSTYGLHTVKSLLTDGQYYAGNNGTNPKAQEFYVTHKTGAGALTGFDKILDISGTTDQVYGTVAVIGNLTTTRGLTGDLTGNADTATSADKVANSLSMGNYLVDNGAYDGSTARTLHVNASKFASFNTLVARDGSGNFAAGTITASLTGNATTATTADKVGAQLTPGGFLTGTVYDGSNARTFAVDAVATNTANKVVVRDGSGNFAAGTITASLTGNASGSSGSCTGNSATATKLIQARTIGGASFDGSAAIVPYTIDMLDEESTAAERLICFAQGSGVQRLANDGDLKYNPSTSTVTATTFAGALTGNSATATKLAAVVKIGNVNFDGSVAIVPETVSIADEEDAVAERLICFANADGTQQLKNDGDLKYNPSTGTLSATKFSGAFSGTVTQVANTLTPGTYITGAAFDGSVARTFAVDATTANTASKVVVRDGSGNFAAGTITASLTGNVSGNAGTVTTADAGNVNAEHRVGFFPANSGSQVPKMDGGLFYNPSSNILTATNVKIQLDESNNPKGVFTGPLTGNADTATKVNNTLTPGTYITGAAFDGSNARTFAVDAVATNTANKVVVRDGSGNFAAGTITASLTGNASGSSGSCTGNSATATKLIQARTIGGASFDGSAAIVPYTIDMLDEESTAAERLICFAQGSGVQRLANDGDLKYNPSTSTVTATTFAGALTGNSATATKLAAAVKIGNVNFDGSVAIVPETVSIADEEDAVAERLICFANADGTQQLKNDGDFKYKPSTGMLTATGVTSELTGNASTATTLKTQRKIGNVSFNGSIDIVPETVSIADEESTAAERLICFADAGGTQQLKNDGDFKYNPSTGTVTATKLKTSGGVDVDSLQTEVNAVETGAGLAANGAYVAPVGSNYLDAASTLKDADSKLDTAIKAEVDRASGAETALDGRLDSIEGGNNTMAGNKTFSGSSFTVDGTTILKGNVSIQGVLTSSSTASNVTVDTYIKDACIDIGAHDAGNVASDFCLKFGLEGTFDANRVFTPGVGKKPLSMIKLEYASKPEQGYQFFGCGPGGNRDEAGAITLMGKNDKDYFSFQVDGTDLKLVHYLHSTTTLKTVAKFRAI